MFMFTNVHVYKQMAMFLRSHLPVGILADGTEFVFFIIYNLNSIIIYNLGQMGKLCSTPSFFKGLAGGLLASSTQSKHTV